MAPVRAAYIERQPRLSCDAALRNARATVKRRGSAEQAEEITSERVLQLFAARLEAPVQPQRCKKQRIAHLTAAKRTFQPSALGTAALRMGRLVDRAASRGTQSVPCLELGQGKQRAAKDE